MMFNMILLRPYIPCERIYSSNYLYSSLKESDGQARASAHCASWKGPPGGRAGGLQADKEEVLGVLLDGQA